VDALSNGAHGDFPQCTLPLEIQDGGMAAIKLKLPISRSGSNLEVIFTGYYSISMENRPSDARRDI